MGITFKPLGLIAYPTALDLMRQFNTARSEDTKDEIWILEHPHVITLGISTKENQVKPGTPIQVITTDRGGQATCHNPGQLVIYFLLDLKRLSITIKSFVSHLEQSIISSLKYYGIDAYTKQGKPGVFVADKKIASLGLRISHGYTSHGIGLNICNDLSIFSHIHPCGNPLQQVTSMQSLGVESTVEEVATTLIPILNHELTSTL
ncbi:MAG: lipoyl(octanoyl) transferase LipB [Methylacidiphilales bacterium]|nr:lipoyl(octanoyl) transferase LipB [Candidatus Methylacidiphilales bacterium]